MLGKGQMKIVFVSSVNYFAFKLIIEAEVKCQLTYKGGSDKYTALKLASKMDRAYSIEECYTSCSELSDCGGFLHGIDDGHCLLLREGCQKRNNNDWNYYAMQDCTHLGAFFIL